jgi:3-hydroxybutyryl-CoA dehydrogenase
MSIERVGIIGSGIMGSGIAEVVAAAGYTVILRSRRRQSADAMLAGLSTSLAKQVEKGKRTQDEADAIAGRVTATAHLGDLVDADLVLESVVEDLAVKKALFEELDSVCKPGAILATNTSTLPVVEMAMATGRPDLVCGIHFFNPAPAMALVEVVRPVTATDATMAAALEFAAACGKDPVEVKDQAGRLLEQGVASKEGIDAAMKGGCGFPMGPFALLDLVGLDTSVAILDALYDEFRDPNYATVPLLRRLVTSGQLGRKTGRGFYDYNR